MTTSDLIRCFARALIVVGALGFAALPAFGQQPGLTSSVAPSAAEDATPPDPVDPEPASEPEPELEPEPEFEPEPEAEPELEPEPEAEPAPTKKPRRPAVRPKRPRPERRPARAETAADASIDLDAAAPDGSRPDAGLIADGGRLAVLPPMTPSPEALIFSLWPLLALLLLFVALRVAHRIVKGAAGEGRRWGIVAARIWSLLEASIWVVGIIVVTASAVDSRGSPVLYALLGLVLITIAAQWNSLRDVAAGLVFAAERPFDVGDVVRVGAVDGQVVRLRLRFLELETAAGRRIQIPYREAVGMTDVRAGGATVAHPVQLDLELPAAMEPTEALNAARELAASSPWSVLGVPPRVELKVNADNKSVISVEGYAFDREVQASLHADLLGGWRDVLRTLSEPGPRT